MVRDPFTPEFRFSDHVTFPIKPCDSNQSTSMVEPGVSSLKSISLPQRYFLGLSLAYEQPLMLPAVKEVPAKIRANNIEEKPLHVLVLGLDSVSRLNAHRQFPQTLEFLQSKKNFVELFGYNKIGVDSNPNQIPLLTGVPHSYASDRIGLNPPVNLTRYIWDYYADRGFRTMYYAEKHDPKISVFPPSGGFQKVSKLLRIEASCLQIA